MERFEFDPEKDRINKERHGIGLGWAQDLFLILAKVARR
jgi:uncharacterized DUF497 family protein